MPTHVKTILLSVVLYLTLFVVPVGFFINKAQEGKSSVTISSEKDEDSLISIWVNPNVMSVEKNDDFTELEPGHFVSDIGGAELTVKRLGSVAPYIEMSSEPGDVTLTVSKGTSHFEYNYSSSDGEVERVLLSFKINSMLIHLVCWGILAVTLLLLEGKLKHCKAVLYCWKRKAFLLVLFVFAIVFLWIPLSAIIKPVYYTIQNTKNVTGRAVSNIWIDPEMIQVISHDGYEEVEEGHYVSRVENSQVIIKKNPAYKGDLKIHIVADGEGAYHLIKNRFEVFEVDSCDTEQIELVAVDIPSGGAIWAYIRMLVFFVAVIMACVVLEGLKKIRERADGTLSILTQGNALISKYKDQGMAFCMFAILFIAGFGMLFRNMYCADDFYGAYGRMISDEFFFKIDKFGRPIATIMSFLFRKVIKGYPHSYNGVPSLLIFMLASVLSCCIIFDIWKKQLNANYRNSVIIFSLAGLMVLNPLTSELAMFNGARSTYVWGIPAALWAAKKFLEKKKNILLPVLFLTLSLFTYQACGAYYIIVCCIGLNIDYIQSHEKGFDKTKFKELVKRYVNCAVCYIIPCILNRLWLSLVVSSRQHYKIEAASSISGLADKWNVFCQWVASMVTTGRGYMTQNAFPLVIIASGLIFLLIWYRSAKINKTSVLLVMMVAFFVSFSSIFYFQFFMKNIWIDARTCTALFGLPAIFIVPGLAVLEKENGIRTNQFRMVFVALCVVFLSLSLKDAQINSMKLYAGNVADYERSRFYLERMEEYEEETGNDITEVAFWADGEPTWRYGDYSGEHDTTANPGTLYEAKWSRNAVLSLMAGKEMKLINDIPDVVLEKWEGKNWDSLNEEQVICIGSRAYIALY